MESKAAAAPCVSLIPPPFAPCSCDFVINMASVSVGCIRCGTVAYIVLSYVIIFLFVLYTLN